MPATCAPRAPGGGRDRAPRARRRGAGAALGSSSSASASSSDSTARRCSPCEPNWRRSRSPLAISTSSRCGPDPGRAALEVAREARARALRPSAAPRRTRAARRASPSSSARSANGGASAASVARRAATSSAPSAARRSVHGSSAAALRKPELDPPQRCVSLRKRREVVLRQSGAGGKRRPSARSKYARRAAGPPFTTVERSGVKTSVATSRRRARPTAGVRRSVAPPSPVPRAA